ALTCICASSGLLWVLMWGRLATPAASQAAWMRAILRSTLSMSMTAQGVPYSRAILAARGVVICFLLLRLVGWVERSDTHRCVIKRSDGFRFALPILRVMPVRSLRATLPAPASGLRRRQAPAAPWRLLSRRPRTSCDPLRRAPDHPAPSAAWQS